MFPITSEANAASRRHSTATTMSPASIDRPPTVLGSTTQGPPTVYHPFSPAVIALLMPASVFGVLARLGLQALGTYDGKSIFPLAYPQAVGCLIMGIVLPLKDTIGDYYGPLYTAIATGFCGSLTTFSGWQLDVFFSWINEGHSRRNGLRDAVDGIGKIVFTLSISMASLFLGIHVGTKLLPVIPKLRPPSSVMQYAVPIISVLVYGATFPAYFCLSASFRHQATAALLFSFPGTLTRYVLSILLNPRFKVFPVGTLVANEFGTSLLATFHALQGLRPPVSAGACSILQGLDDGYCGCLTTVSTFVSELRVLGDRKGLVYGTISVIVGQALMVLILGSAVWTGSVSSQISCTPIL